MKLKISATRMELLRLRKKLELARKGHKLLKDKLDQLVREFLKLIHRAERLREEVEDEWQEVISYYFMARGEMSLEDAEEAFSNPPNILKVERSERFLFNVRLPSFKLSGGGEAVDLINYGMANTSGDLDSSLKTLGRLIPKILELASVERAILILGEEIKKTRRKVNALEYKMIPDIEETLFYISFRLSEIERENFIRLMKVKERLKGE